MSDKTKWLRLEPVDAWFFRDSRPSNAGEDQSDLESVFPPYPTTVVGALRAALARKKGWSGKGRWSKEFNEVLGDGFNDLGKLSFQGPFLEKDGELLFPMPRHVLGRVKEKENKLSFVCEAFLSPSPEKISTDSGEIHLPVPPKLKEGNGRQEGDSKPPGSADEFYVTSSGLEAILQGKLPESDQCIYRKELFIQESRVGIKRDGETYNTKEGGMYSPHYVRLQPGVALVMSLDGLPEKDWSLPTHFPLGGESRMARCHLLDEAPSVPKNHQTSENSVLINVVPVRFGEPWWGGGPGEEASRLHKDLAGKITTVAVDRPLKIGGWDSEKTEPLPLRPFVPPGSVWWIEGDNSHFSSESPISLGDSTPYGFGLSLVGVRPDQSSSGS